MDNYKRPFASDTGPEKGVSNIEQFENDNKTKHDFSGLTGFSLAEIIGKGASKLVFGNSEDRKQVEKWMVKTKNEIRMDNTKVNESQKSNNSKRLLSRVKQYGNFCRTLFSAMIRNQNVKSYYL